MEAQPTFAISAVWKRFKKHRTAVFGSGIVLTVLGMAILAPIISPYSPYLMAWKRLQPPNSENWMGTDHLGRDVFSRIIWGSRLTLLIGFGASTIAAIIGITVGAVAGYYRKFIDTILMRICDVILIFPSYFLYIFVVAMLRSRSTHIMILLLGFTMWPRLARIVRSEFLSLRERDFAKAAKALGAGDMRIIFRHLLPNSMAPIIVTYTMNIAVAILVASSLSFLGLGNPTAVEWGAILIGAHQVILSGWWITLFPGVLIFLLVLGFNLAGDGLRDSLDPRLKGRI